eukprot:g11726.t1
MTSKPSGYKDYDLGKTDCGYWIDIQDGDYYLGDICQISLSMDFYREGVDKKWPAKQAVADITSVMKWAFSKDRFSQPPEGINQELLNAGAKECMPAFDFAQRMREALFWDKDQSSPTTTSKTTTTSTTTLPKPPPDCEAVDKNFCHSCEKTSIDKKSGHPVITVVDPNGGTDPQGAVPVNGVTPENAKYSDFPKLKSMVITHRPYQQQCEKDASLLGCQGVLCNGKPCSCHDQLEEKQEKESTLQWLIQQWWFWLGVGLLLLIISCIIIICCCCCCCCNEEEEEEEPSPPLYAFVDANTMRKVKQESATNNDLFHVKSQK